MSKIELPQSQLHRMAQLGVRRRPGSEPRPGKKVAAMTVHEPYEFAGKIHRFMRVVSVTERSIDKKGQYLTVPDIELEGWWTSPVLPEEDVIKLYEAHGTSEQFQGEIKSDIDMKRLPSGKFATNALVLTYAGFAYNILRLIGQMGLCGDNSPVRHPAKRRRIRTVIQEIMTAAARMFRSARQCTPLFGRHQPGLFFPLRPVLLKTTAGQGAPSREGTGRPGSPSPSHGSRCPRSPGPGTGRWWRTPQDRAPR